MYTWRFVEAAQRSGTPVDLHLHEGYGHGYWFVQTFVGEHLAHHHRKRAEFAQSGEAGR